MNFHLGYARTNIFIFKLHYWHILNPKDNYEPKEKHSGMFLKFVKNYWLTGHNANIFPKILEMGK